MSARSVLAAGTILAALMVGGCATNQRFETTTPTRQLTGEAICEVPQHWKALALEGVNTRTLSQATMVQIRIPAEWVGDALGWFVEKWDDSSLMDDFPRQTWKAFIVDPVTGEKKFFPAVMLNPLKSPYLTVIITDPSITAGQTVQVYVLSGAHTKLLTTVGDRLTLPDSLNCLGWVDAGFTRVAPSPAYVEKMPTEILDGLRYHFPIQGKHVDGVVYSKSEMAYNPKVMGDNRRITRAERTAKRGAEIVVFPPGLTLISGAIAGGVHLASPGGEYYGPFGERQYSPPEALLVLNRMAREYNHTKRGMEAKRGVPYSGDFAFRLDLDRPRSGWEIGEMLALQVEAAWEVLDRLEGRVSLSKRRERR